MNRREENQRVDDDAPKNNSINQIVKNKMGVDTNEMAKRKRNESNPMIQQHYTYHYFYYDLMPSITGGGGRQRLDSESFRFKQFLRVVYLSNERYTLRMWSRAESKFVKMNISFWQNSGIHYYTRIRIIPWTAKFLSTLAVHDRPGLFYHLLSSGG